MKKLLLIAAPFALLALTGFTEKTPAALATASARSSATTLSLAIVCYSQAGYVFDVLNWSVDGNTTVQDTYNAIQERELNYWGFNYTIGYGVNEATGKTLDPTKTWSENGVTSQRSVDVHGTIE